jgi:hexosaminidase
LKTALKVVGVILLVLASGLAIAWFGFLRPKPPPIAPADRAAVGVLPLPAELKLRQGVFLLTGDLSHEFAGVSTPRLERALRRFYAGLTSATGVAFGAGTARRLVLDCAASSDRYPSLGDDESYSIEITGSRVRVKAPSETGIIYGLETLRQLVTRVDDHWALPRLTLRDHPRYSWRGLMIDASRHWIPKAVILRNLDAMAAVKLNVLHWHLSDYQGFRVESKEFPRLQQRGSGGHFYTQEDIRQVVDSAADRGIRVVPEFDLPGHSTSWFVGYPELASAPGPYVIDSVFGVLKPVMDPTRDTVYEFLDRFFGEMAWLFPDAYVHVGGDEVVGTEWEGNARIRQFMSANRLADAPALQAYFNGRLRSLLKAHGKRMMGWDEILHSDLPADGVVVQTWREQRSLWESARQGYKAVLSAGYYLDYKQPAAFHYGVDPEVIPGAVTIDIDSTHWKGWDCRLTMRDLDMQTQLFLFGEGGEGKPFRGIVNFNEGFSGFTDAVLQGNHLVFSIETNFGTVKFDAELQGDSITGSAKISFFTLQLNGRRSGGSDMPGGRPLPEFRKTEPLTSEQAANLIGGEACMWSEMVDGTTLESRVWPRAAAVAEKLWSPRALTSDTRDLYRRLMVLDDRLEERGLAHRSYRESLLRGMAPPSYLGPLRTLVSVLEEDKFFNRMDLYKPLFTTATPLDRVMDAAPAESYPAYRFGQEVDHWLESHDETTRARLVTTLEDWASNYERLEPAFRHSERMREVELHSRHLSTLASLALQSLSMPATSISPAQIPDTLFTAARAAHGGTLLAVVGALQRLLRGSAGP